MPTTSYCSSGGETKKKKKEKKKVRESGGMRGTGFKSKKRTRARKISAERKKKRVLPSKSPPEREASESVVLYSHGKTLNTVSETGGRCPLSTHIQHECTYTYTH